MIKVFLVLIVMPLSGEPIVAQYEQTSLAACMAKASHRLNAVKGQVNTVKYLVAGCALSKTPEQKAGN